MYLTQITKNDVEIINRELNKRFFKTFFFLIILFIVSFLFIYCLTISYLDKWYVLLLDLSILIFWIYLWIISFLKTILIKNNIKNKTVLKIKEDFIVIQKETETFSQEGSYDSYNYYLKIVSKKTLKEKKISVQFDDYCKIKVKKIITILYYDKLEIILKVQHDEIIFKKSEFITKSELNIFKILKKYR